ncbi:hypothetical protein GWK36_01305 [Caldichromatium japonicum]|uniref:Uncharacterized protein n=1 Tax=Caldichromatium japonicum TaxID=2699430 RepID=A0A6G7VAP0_9GAMM|nr:hypothetical protein [Caldichromatium japonicum]QIK36857.1 hypothetical protein GWK36_01305 [Caldichromatium japonicum]
MGEKRALLAGKTPEIRVTHRREGLSVISTVTNRGKVRRVVNLERLTFITHHIRDGIENPVYSVSPIVQPKSERIVKGALWPW